MCVTGAATMALIKGQKLLNAQLPSSHSLLLNSTGSDNIWLLGCLCLFGSSCCWSFWLIIQVHIDLLSVAKDVSRVYYVVLVMKFIKIKQVPVTRNYPDHLSLSAWMCFIATIQSAVVTMFTDPDLEAWKVTSYLQLGSLLYAVIIFVTYFNLRCLVPCHLYNPCIRVPIDEVIWARVKSL